MDKITEFQGEYRFLSNFYPALVKFDGVNYPSVEHAYQAAKTLDPVERQKIALCGPPNKAKKMGRDITLRKDWESIKLAVMEELVTKKFKDSALKQLLLDTEDAQLIEGNTWGGDSKGTRQI